ncbi:MAG TPA: hypothetical protein DEP88_07700 [Verrucomicrobiales bacterium]|jgi:hypothetical protein|nr:hypothetical protein [Verrucomicrobiales bacterium]HCI91202.1 hypothetical protein [Verrucomicrobiales bacterium]HCL96994.1 hypothetical protein [Verrucomicrobiales bacterium]
MGKKEQIAKRKQELTAKLSENRVLINTGRNNVKQMLSVKKQLRNLVLRKPKAIFFGSVGAGLLATLALKRPKKTHKKKSSTITMVLLRWVLSLMQPAAKTWLINRAKIILAQQLETRRRSQTQTDL